MFLFSMLHRQKPSYRTPLHCCNCCSAPHLQQSEGEGETYRRVGVSGGSAWGRDVSAYGRVGGWEKRNGVSAGRHAWRGRVALPRDRRCTSGNFPFADYAATALYPTFTPFCLFKFYERATPVARERNPTVPRVPIRRPAVSFLPHADPPTRRFVSPHTPTRRPAHTPIRFSITLAVFRQERAGICASMLTKPGKRPASCFRLIQIQSSVGGCSPVDNVLLDARWRIGRERVPCGYRSFFEFLILAFILLSHLRVVHVLTSFLIATGKSLTDCYCDGLWLCPVACRGKIA
jgi:hypothetical protein